MKKLSILFLALFLAALWVGTAFAQDPNPTPSDDDVNRVAKELFCPVCENTPLDVCPTEACKQWRELIREKLSEGWTDQQVKDYFVQQYGARVLSEPPRQGWYWAIYLVPAALLVIGVYILFRAYRSMRAPLLAEGNVVETATPAPIADDYLRRVEEELKKRN